MRETTTGTIFSNWKPEYAAKFSRETLKLDHTLHQSALFTDDALIELIEKAERTHYHVNTRASGPDGRKRRREGEFGNLSGNQVLEAVRKGELWINLTAPQAAIPAYGDLLADMYNEFEARVPGLKTFKHKITILISSPNVYVPYHADVPGQMLWQVRGRKRVWLYPRQEPYISQNAIEKLVLGELHEVDMHYDEAFDRGAAAIDLNPGEMLHWPLNWPHRVENYDCVNISITTEHFTRDIRTSYAVNYANGLLRKAGFSNLERQSGGVMAALKTGLAGAVKVSGIGKKVRKPYAIDFAVDPTGKYGVRDIQPYDLKM